MEDVNDRLEALVKKMKEIGERPYKSYRGTSNDLLEYNAIRNSILAVFLGAFENGYRLKKEE